jgi:phthalate 4,5-dioxygenase oxygenase subunit
MTKGKGADVTMLTSEENELLCRVEGNAPMGQLMRRHWIPACLSEQLSDVDGPPVPVRLLGEDLLAWRDSDGRVGLMDRKCPHRRASLALARNENGGLRCLYHGWKLDVEGKVLEMPSEPAESALLKKARHKAYPTHEYAGFVWAYMGPRDTMPDFEPPAFAPTAETKVSIISMQANCNWAQMLEGAIDSAHSSSLHSSEIAPARGSGTQTDGFSYGRPSTDKAPRLQVQPTDYGFKYAAVRRPIVNSATHDYVRTTIFLAPFTTLIPPNNMFNIAIMNIPMDDTHTMFHLVAWSDSGTGGIDQESWREYGGARVGIDVDQHYRKILRHADNNYAQDRQAMKDGNFTGIFGIPNQDIAVAETMGPILDRSSELLAASDQAIVVFRRMMVDAAAKFHDGEAAIGTQQHALQLGRPYIQQAALRSFEGVLPKGTEWRDLDMAEAQAQRAMAVSPN